MQSDLRPGGADGGTGDIQDPAAARCGARDADVAPEVHEHARAVGQGAQAGGQQISRARLRSRPQIQERPGGEVDASGVGVEDDVAPADPATGGCRLGGDRGAGGAAVAAGDLLGSQARIDHPLGQAVRAVGGDQEIGQQRRDLRPHPPVGLRLGPDEGADLGVRAEAARSAVDVGEHGVDDALGLRGGAGGQQDLDAGGPGGAADGAQGHVTGHGVLRGRQMAAVRWERGSGEVRGRRRASSAAQDPPEVEWLRMPWELVPVLCDEVDDELVPVEDVSEDVVSVEDAVSEPLASVEVVPSVVDVVSVEELSEESSAVAAGVVASCCGWL